MTDQEIFAIFRPHIIRVTGVPEFILYAQNQNAPKGAYGSLQVRSSIDERGQAIIHKKHLPLEAKFEIDVRPQLHLTCVAEFFRGDAKLYAQRLLQMGKREDVIWPLFQQGISIRNVGNVMDLTALQASNFEHRARVEIHLWMEGSSKYAINEITGVQTEYQNEAGDILQAKFIGTLFE